MSNQVAIDSRYVNCNLAPGTIQRKPVWPGATMVAGRADQKRCVTVDGHIVGLGVDDHRTWTPPVDALGKCDAAVGTTGAGTALINMDPTVLGDIWAWTNDVGEGARVIYSTVDH